MQILQDSYFAQRDKVKRKGVETMGETANKDQAAPKKSWFKGLKAEFNRIVWPDKETLAKQTTAVVVISLFLGLVIAFLDLIIKFGLRFLI